MNEIRPADVIQWQNEIMKLKKDNGEDFINYIKNYKMFCVIFIFIFLFFIFLRIIWQKSVFLGEKREEEIFFFLLEGI